jgi:hypothetical protein
LCSYPASEVSNLISPLIELIDDGTTSTSDFERLNGEEKIKENTK